MKLTSFELATDVALDKKAEIERKYKRNSKVFGLSEGDIVDGVGKATKSPKPQNVEDMLKEKYRAASKVPIVQVKSYSARSFRDMDVKFLPYCVDYRRQLAVFNYQPPELLNYGERFVFPTEGSDVYSLTLVLWELLNHCVPFAIYKEDELMNLYAVQRARLPTFEEERCIAFKQIFKFSFEPDPIKRSMTVHHLIQSLEDLKLIRAHQPDHSHVMHENSLYGSTTAKPIATAHVTTEKSPATKHSENHWENTLETIPVQAKTQQSPLNNVTNSTLQRSILDYQKLLSPLRAANANIYERARTSTLKKRKKQTPTKRPPSSVREPAENNVDGGNGIEDTMNFGDGSSPELNENIQVRGRSTLDAAKRKPSMVRNLNYENDNAAPPVAARQNSKFHKNSQSLIEQLPAAPANQSKVNNSSYQFAIDDYELPQHLIARNNKIRRNTWLSSDTMNTTTNSMATHVPLPNAVKPSASIQKTPPMNESGKSNKTLNVTLRIVTKQLTPPGSEKSDSSVASNNSIDNVSVTEDSPSVLTRIQFFRSLENPSNFAVGRRSGDYNKSRRSEISFDEAVKQSNRRTQLRSLSAASPPLPNNNRQLLKDINDIADEISKCLNNHRFEQRRNAASKCGENNLHVGYVSPVHAIPKAMENDKSVWQADKDQSKKSVKALVQSLFGDAKDAGVDEVDDEFLNEKRNSVKETVQRFENVLQHQQTPPSHNVSVNGPFRKIENKLLNEKIVNTESKSPVKMQPSPQKMVSNAIQNSNSVERTEEMCEKVEEVMQIVGLSECENDAGQPTNVISQATTRSKF